MLTGNMEFLQWDCQDVARWIESLGFPQYTACFTENHITGRKLIYVNCVYMPRLGITDFKDMQAIAAGVRELLGITEPPWSRSVADPRRDAAGLFLEQKSRTGDGADGLAFRRSPCDVSQAERVAGARRESRRRRSAAESKACQCRFTSAARVDSDETLAAGRAAAL